MMKKINFSKSFISYFFIIAVILLLIFLNYKGWLEAPKGVTSVIFNPVLRSFQWSANQFGAGIKIFTTLKDLISENNSLKQANQKLWQENSSLKEVARENEVLRQRLALGPVQNHKLILAGIVGFNPEAGHFFLIDKGQAEGVAVNLAVVTENNFLVGKIIDVGLNSAKVLLILDSNSSISALTQDSRAGGIVKGTHGLGLEMDLIPIQEQIKSGENVLTSGRDEAIPAGLVIGRISDTIVKETEVFQKAIIQPATEFDKLESVFVIQ